MKLRKGFVSNSSTTSFLIFGISLEPDEAEKMLRRDNPDVRASIAKYGEGDALEILDGVIKGVQTHYSEWGDHKYFGLSWDSVQDDETGAQFKERVRIALAEYLEGDLNLSTHEEAFYNG